MLDPRIVFERSQIEVRIGGTAVRKLEIAAYGNAEWVHGAGPLVQRLRDAFAGRPFLRATRARMSEIPLLSAA